MIAELPNSPKTIPGSQAQPAQIGPAMCSGVMHI